MVLRHFPVNLWIPLLPILHLRLRRWLFNGKVERHGDPARAGQARRSWTGTTCISYKVVREEKQVGRLRSPGTMLTMAPLAVHRVVPLDPYSSPVPRRRYDRLRVTNLEMHVQCSTILEQVRLLGSKRRRCVGRLNWVCSGVWISDMINDDVRISSSDGGLEWA